VGGIQERTRIELILRSEPGSTGKLRRAVDRLADQFGLVPEERFDVKLAATEALTNAVKQAGDEQVVEVVLEGSDGVVDVEVADRGRFVQPPPRHGFSEGGRGIPLMLALVDEVEFAQKGDGTRVRMRKRISR
jgi:serine/threonine-protein kinase RsbW